MAEKKKIIDEKGKLFGKINIIDLVILAVLAAVIVVIGSKLTGRSIGLPGMGAETELNYTVVVSRVPQDVYDAVAQQVAAGPEANTLMASGNLLEGSYVVSVSSVPYRVGVEAADGSFVLSEEPGYVDATFVLKALATNAVTQAVGSQEVRIGKTHIVKTQTFELMNGTILSVEVGK